LAWWWYIRTLRQDQFEGPGHKSEFADTEVGSKFGEEDTALPDDDIERPMPPPAAAGSASGRNAQQRRLQCRLQYPLIFDNRRWIALNNEPARSHDEKHDPPASNKFFGALVKPSVSTALNVLSSCNNNDNK